MAFSPFLQSQTAQDIISNYFSGQYAATPNVNSAGMWRNPEFDIRTQQELAGELDPSALFPNPIMDWSATSTAPTVDPCPEGYQLIDGVCQPNEQFSSQDYSSYSGDESQESGGEERPYYSIEEMKGLKDYELLDYLNSGWLKGKPYDVSVGGNFMPSWFNLPFGKQNKMRRDFIINELKKRGYDTTSDQGQKSLGQALSIIGNAQASNQGVMPNQVSFFTPEEVNYQIQAKNEAQDIVNQGGNPYGQSFSGTPEQIHQQVVQDAIQSGGTVNPFEAQGINTSTPSTPSLPSDWADLI
tara:strand:+ start:164 stop:1057 length:894 start_codon:yes stop_codon:yes gene_type:complete